ncbi:hypothetical protein [Dyadobacter diqingensis]|uniref:hypothetical protein n=1 Tax=Dyadobacter diqingensis TaxID=2938121 RepID=UPI0020C49E66|nr:hypothetical protein [Dyadobacter diqingensis]
MKDQDFSLEQFKNELKPELVKSWELKENLHPTWNYLIKELETFRWKFGPIRDMFYDSNDGFKAILRIKSEMGDSELVGIIFHVSLIGNQIGLYYADSSKTEVNQNPISPARKTSMLNTSPLTFVKDLSYFPLNQLHADCAPDLIAIIVQHFPDFKVFDNIYAECKVDSIQTEGGYYQNIDLFQVIFGTNIHGVI